MTGQEQFLSVMKRRYACKLYDQSRPITDADKTYILECGRLSPSSFGLEHWQLYAVCSKEKKAQLFSACFSQEAVMTSSMAVVAVCRRDPSYDPDGSFIRERGSRFPGGLGVFVDDYRGYYEFLRTNKLTDHWARAQCYIACANMMTGAAAAGIDSCAIEGFENEKVLEMLGLPPALWLTGIITVFGYCAADDSREKIRMPATEIIAYV